MTIEDVAFELDEADRAEAQFPESARGVQKVEMRGEWRGKDLARHRKTAFEERPVEGFAVKGDENRALRDTCCEFVKE